MESTCFPSPYPCPGFAYTTVTRTVSEEDPSIVLVQDQTASMGIFPEGQVLTCMNP